MILYFYAIQQRAEVPEIYMKYFRLASRCHAQIESIATKGSLMDRFGVVLQELRLEVLRNKNHLVSMSTPQATGGPSTSGEVSSGPDARGPRSRGNPVVGGSAGEESQQLAGGDMAASATSSSGMEAFDSALLHMAGWGQFDSLVNQIHWAGCCNLRQEKRLT